jgi:multiple sugar transport system permease protein
MEKSLGLKKALINARKYFKSERTFNTVIMVPALIFLMAMMLFPLAQSFYTSFTSMNLIKPGSTNFIGLNNYLEAFRDPYFINALKNSAWFTTITIIFQLVLGLVIAQLLSYRKLVFRGFWRTLLLLPMFVASVVVGFQWKWLLIDRYGVINQILRIFNIKEIYWLTDKFLAKLSVIITDSWSAIPFMVLVIHASILMIPTDISEAAQIDGASGFKLFRYITLPSIKPAILIVLLIRVMDSLKTFDAIYVLTRGGPASETELLSLYVFRQAFTNFKMGYASAISYLQFFLILAFSIILIRSFVKR